MTSSHDPYPSCPPGIRVVTYRHDGIRVLPIGQAIIHGVHTPGMPLSNGYLDMTGDNDTSLQTMLLE